MKNYILRNIRELLIRGFSTTELSTLCFDDFRSVYDDLPQHASKVVIVQKLLEYADDKIQPMDVLLDWAKQNSPVRFDAHQPYYREQPETEVAKSFRSTTDKLIKLFNLKTDNPEITIYLSRHSAIAQLPTINVSPSDIAEDPTLKKIYDFQLEEAKQLAESQKISPRAFAVVSAIEMIESFRLMNEIDRSSLLDWFTGKVQEKLLRTSIKVKLDICPEQDKYKRILEEDTVIFIGGSRANLGTFYYLFQEEAGELRPKRFPKNVIEYIGDPKNRFTCSSNRNLGIIQKHQTNSGDKTIIYLAGTGVNGTVAAIAYMRLHWLDLLKEFGNNNFSRVIEVDRRTKEDITGYISKDWTDDDWIVLDRKP